MTSRKKKRFKGCYVFRVPGFSKRICTPPASNVENDLFFSWLISGFPYNNLLTFIMLALLTSKKKQFLRVLQLGNSNIVLNIALPEASVVYYGTCFFMKDWIYIAIDRFNNDNYLLQTFCTCWDTHWITICFSLCNNNMRQIQVVCE